jgi:hypothetical protein
MVRKIVLAAFLAGASLPVMAQEAAPPAAAPAAMASADKPVKLICRTSGVTGSRLRQTRTCLTKEEWIKRDQGTQEAMRVGVTEKGYSMRQPGQVD